MLKLSPMAQEILGKGLYKKMVETDKKTEAAKINREIEKLKRRLRELR